MAEVRAPTPTDRLEILSNGWARVVFDWTVPPTVCFATLTQAKTPAWSVNTRRYSVPASIVGMCYYISRLPSQLSPEQTGGARTRDEEDGVRAVPV